MRRWVCALLWCMVTAGPALSAGAQNTAQARSGGVMFTAEAAARDGLSFTVHAGYGGVYRPGRWTPVDVVVRARVPREQVHTAGGSVRGTLRVTIHTGVRIRETHVVAVDVPVMGERRYAFLVLPDAESVHVEFEPAQSMKFSDPTEGRAFTRRIAGTVRMRPVAEDAVLVATMRGNERALRFLGGKLPDTPLDVVTLTPEDLPGTAAGWFGADAVVLSLAELGGLAPALQDAVLQWVRSGGELVLTYDGSAAQLSDEAAAALPAVPGIGRQVVADRTLEQFGDAPFGPGGRIFIALDQPTVRGTVLLAVGGVPLITRRNVESGTITLIGANLGAPPFSGWAGVRKLWDVLLLKRVRPEIAQVEFRSRILNAFLGFREVSLAGFTGLLLAFALYALVLGGGLAAVLRRLGHAEWYWGGAGAVMLCVLCVTMLNPAALSSDHTSVRTVSLLHARSGANIGRLDAWAAGTAHVRDRIRLAMSARSGAMRQFVTEPELGELDANPHVTHAREPVAEDVEVEALDATLLVSTDVVTAVPDLQCVRVDPEQYRIRNRTGTSLAHVALVSPFGFTDFGTVGAGSDFTVRPRADVRTHTWQQLERTHQLMRVLPTLFSSAAPAVDVPGGLSPTILTPDGRVWIGAGGTDVVLVAWWPLAGMPAGDADGVPSLRGHTLLVITPEEP